MLLNRQLKLLELLKKEKQYKTVSYYANKLGVSKRTLYTALQGLQDSGVSIAKKRGVGILLENSQGPDLGQDATSDTSFERRMAIFYRLLFEEEQTSFTELSERYFVSKTSIKQDLDLVNQALSKGSRLRLISDHRGTRLSSGRNEDRVDALVQFNHLVLHQQSLLASGGVEDEMDCLSVYYSTSVVQVCKNILYSFVKENVNAISETYIQSFLNLLIATVFLLRQGRHLVSKRQQQAAPQHAFYIDSAVKILHKASLRLSFTYTNGDVAYLSQKLLQYRFEPMPTDGVDDVLVHSLIEDVSKALNVDFSNDACLFEQLKVHIPPMIARLKDKSLIKNPFTEQIKLEYSVVFNVLWIAIADFSQEIGIEFNDDEIAFLTIYFQLAIEKLGNSRKILVVCPMGIVTSELLIHRIKQAVPSFDSVEVASIMELDNLQLGAYDLILTTTQLAEDVPHAHTISPLISSADLSELLNSQGVKGCSPSIEPSTLGNYLQRETIYLDEGAASYKEVIAKIGHHLQGKGYIDGRFVASVLEREQLGSTDMPLGVALPHGMPQTVKKSFVALIRTQKKFKWKDYFVDVIFLIGIAQEDMKEIKSVVSHLYQLIDSDECLRYLRQTKTKEEVLQIVYGRENHYS